MKWALYNLLFAIVYPFLLPGFLLRMFRRGGYAARMGDRFALYPDGVKQEFESRRGAEAGRLVWIHAVSVGEVQVAGQLIREWRNADPEIRFCFSTTSSTGWKMAQREVDEAAGDVLIYNPLDFPNFVKSALKLVRPRAIILTESEIWPNFILTARKMRIPLFLINARVSDRSAPRYRLAKFFFKDVLGAFTTIFAQSEMDKERLVAAGAPSEKVEVTGSFKFDVAHRNEAKERELEQWVFGDEGRKPSEKILLGGSTWPGEDEVMLRMYSAAKGKGSLRLVIAPRHFEKADQIEANIKAAGFSCRRRSRGDVEGEVMLADTTGELMGLYGIADFVFVGKSLCAHGSQNMIEPCLCGKPTFVGPYTENFRPVMSDLLAADAIVQVANEKELVERMGGIMEDDAEATSLGERAKSAVIRRLGVVKKCVESVRGAMSVLMLVVICGICGCSERDKESDMPPLCKSVETAVAAIVKLESASGVEGFVFKELDATDMTMEQFARELKTIDGEVHLWMPGHDRWLLVGRPESKKTSLSDVMEVFAFGDELTPVHEVFASYVGTRKDIEPAFIGVDMSAKARMEYFVTKEIPALPWLDATGSDGDIRRKVLSDIRSMQVVRRLIVEGDMIAENAVDKTKQSAAVDMWARAAKRNLQDPLLQERIERLERNAKVFLEAQKVLQAMKCYETILMISPNNAVAVHNFGICLKKLGKTELAAKALKRAEELSK